MRHLHIGVKPRALSAVLRFAHGHAEVHTSHVDGDGWLAWGEAPGTDVNDEDTLHVVLEVGDDFEPSRAATMTAALDFALTLAGLPNLVPGSWPGYAETTSVLTDAEDWSVQHGGGARLTLTEVEPSFEERYGFPESDLARGGAAGEVVDAINHDIMEVVRDLEVICGIEDYAYATGRLDALLGVAALLNGAA